MDLETVSIGTNLFVIGISTLTASVVGLEIYLTKRKENLEKKKYKENYEKNYSLPDNYELPILSLREFENSRL
jgi:hypothetical protein